MRLKEKKLSANDECLLSREFVTLAKSRKVCKHKCAKSLREIKSRNCLNVAQSVQIIVVRFLEFFLGFFNIL
jgi:hypothetical protein